MRCLIGLMLLTSVFSHAEDNGRAAFFEAQKQIYEKMSDERKNKDMVQHELGAAQLYKNRQDVNEKIAGLQFGVKKKLSEEMKVTLNNDANTVRAYYFVSFSIPESGLKEMIVDAGRYQLPMVLNGLKENDITKTAKEFLKYYKDNNSGGMMIDPTVYDEFKVRAVPAIVVACGANKFDMVYGSVKIENALELISRSGDCAQESKIILARDRR